MKQPHGTAVDIYSMGCFYLEMTVGVPVKDTVSQKVLITTNGVNCRLKWSYAQHFKIIRHYCFKDQWTLVDMFSYDMHNVFVKDC